MAGEYSDITVEISGETAVITLDRPELLNALSSRTYRELADAMADLSLCAEVGAIIITGAGRAFSSGGDLKEVGAFADDDAGRRRMARDMVDASHACFAALEGSDQIVVCAVNGLAYAGGLILALCSDIVLAAESAVFQVPEASVGLSDPFLPVRLPQYVGLALAKDIIFSGRKLSAREALSIGLIARVVGDEELMARATEVALGCAQASTTTRRSYKWLLSRQVPGFDRRAHMDSLLSEAAAHGMREFAGRSRR
jgi:enoyl-CoA hydratase